jgi:hypothetical protein
MKIELDLSECPHVELVRRWPSVSRTIANAWNVINDCQYHESVGNDPQLVEKGTTALEELDEIQAMLDWLHKAVQNQLIAKK